MTAYRSGSLACPVCTTPLEPIEAPLPVHGCRSCGGAWLGPEAAVHFLRDPIDATNRQVLEASRRIPFEPRPHPDPEGGRVCAHCSQPMSTLFVGPVRLDTCPAHGTWFDHEEVKRSAEALDAHRQGHPHDEHAETFAQVLDRMVRWFTG